MGKFVIVGNFAIVDWEIANSAKMELSENLRLSENYIALVGKVRFSFSGESDFPDATEW